MNGNPNAITLALVRQIVAQTSCAVCERRFHLNDVSVLGRQGNVWALRVNCRDCQRQDLLLAVLENGKTHPIYTDLTPDEWARFKDRAAISTDEVIAFHTYIQAYPGDWSEILDAPLAAE